MPRRVKGNRGRGKGRRNNSMMAPKVSSVPFHFLLVGTLSGVTGTSVLNLQPQNFGSVSDTADNFDLYRCTKLQYRIHPMDPTDTVMQTLSYYPDVDTQTLTTTQNSESPIAACQTPFCGVPSSWITVPRSMLKGMLDWYKCTPDAGSTEFEVQGALYAVGGLSDQCVREFRGVFQFKNPCSSSLQMTRTIARLERLGLVVRLPKPTPSSTKE